MLENYAIITNDKKITSIKSEMDPLMFRLCYCGKHRVFALAVAKFFYEESKQDDFSCY